MKYLLVTIMTLAAFESLAKSIGCWDRQMPFGRGNGAEISNLGRSHATISLTHNQRIWNSSPITKIERVPVVHQNFRTDYHFKSGSLVISPKTGWPTTEAYYAYLTIHLNEESQERTYLLYCDYFR